MATSESVNLAENLKALRITDRSLDAYQVKVIQFNPVRYVNVV